MSVVWVNLCINILVMYMCLKESASADLKWLIINPLQVGYISLCVCVSLSVCLLPLFLLMC